jgi:hypothetical protein
LEKTAKRFGAALALSEEIVQSSKYGCLHLLSFDGRNEGEGAQLLSLSRKGRENLARNPLLHRRRLAEIQTLNFKRLELHEVPNLLEEPDCEHDNPAHQYKQSND